MGSNPFVGPRPIETGQPIFGRDREREELYYLLSSQRIVLFHSPSGAGKSSLMQAGLIPRLKPLFDVWRPARVNLASNGSAVNRYTRSAILSFEAELPENRRRPESEIAGMTMEQYVRERPRRRSAPKHIVLIFDQFEEILTSDPLALHAKQEFFDQLGRLLRDPGIWALFCLREDYLAPFSAYSEQVPTHLKNLYRLDLLSRSDGQTAISKTAESAGRTFTSEAVAKLVVDLATVQVQREDGGFEKQAGLYVEPMQLQVACRRLWDRMPNDKDTIEITDLAAFGDVTKALAGYYEDEVGKMPGNQRAIREWVGRKLIKGGIRGQVLRGAGASEGLDNELIAHLVDAHLVRAEQRAGATWYELAHDRLIEPVLENNEEWFEANLTKFEKTAAIWDEQGRLPGLLLQGADLVAAREWAKGRAGLTDAEQRFLAESEAAQKIADRERRQARLIRWAAVGLGVLVLIVLGALYQTWRILQKQAMASSVSQAYVSEHVADRDLRVLVALHAVSTWDTREAEEALHSAVQHLQGPRFSSNQDIQTMALNKDTLVTATVVDLSEITFWNVKDATEKMPPTVIDNVQSLALNKNGTVAAVEPRANTIQMIDSTGKLIEKIPYQSSPSSAAFSPEGVLAAGGDNGSVTLYANTKLVFNDHKGPVKGLAFSPSGKYLLSSSEDGTLAIRDLSSAQKPVILEAPNRAPLISLAISPDGTVAATGSSLGSISTWEIPNGRLLGEWRHTQAKETWALVFSPDGKTLVSASADGTAKLWGVKSPGSLEEGLTVPCGDGPEISCNALAFMNDGHTVAVAGADGVWAIETDLRRLFDEARDSIDISQIDRNECRKYLGENGCVVPKKFTEVQRNR